MVLHDFVYVWIQFVCTCMCVECSDSFTCVYLYVFMCLSLMYVCIYMRKLCIYKPKQMFSVSVCPMTFHLICSWSKVLQAK
jgi:hypothetical protein